MHCYLQIKKIPKKNKQLKLMVQSLQYSTRLKNLLHRVIEVPFVCHGNPRPVIGKGNEY